MPLASHASQVRARSSCILCQTELGQNNDSKEHIVPNAIGGRRVIRNFICESCNNKTGREWDSALCEQLHPISVLLDIRRQRGTVRPIEVNTTGGDTLVVQPDGRMGILHGGILETIVGNTTKLSVKARSMRELRKMVPGIVRRYPQLDTKTIMKDAHVSETVIEDALFFPLQFGGHIAGRSIVKSMAALAVDAGVNIEECEHAIPYLRANGEACFGYFNDADIVLNRPRDTFFHCIFVHGDPTKKRLVAYVEYFGYQRILGCLSSEYSGMAFERCYAIDPVTGKELDLQMDTSRIPDDMGPVYSYKRFSNEPMVSALNGLMAYVTKRIEQRVLNEAIEDAWEHACRQCGVAEGDELSESQAKQFAGIIAERVTPAMVRLLAGRRFNANTWRHIRRTMEGGE